MQNAKRIRHLILGLGLIAFGIVLLWKRDAFLAEIMCLIALIVTFGGVVELFWWSYRRLFSRVGDSPIRDLILAFCSLLLGSVMLLFPSLHQYLVPLLFGCYLLLNGTIKCIDSILAVRNHTGQLLSQLLPALFYLAFGMILLFSPRYHLRSVLWIASVYCLLLGGTNLADFVFMLIPVRTRHNLRRRFRFAPPAIVTLLLPHKTLLRLNRYLTRNQGRTAAEFEDIALKKEDAPAELEIFVHVSDNADMRIGHIDVCFENQVIAYGNYDDSTITPLGMGDGVLIRCGRTQYLPFCLNFHKTTIFSFGLRLDPAQQEAVRQRILQLSSQTEEWLPPYPSDFRGGTVRPGGYAAYSDYASRMYEEAGARFFKFTAGRFRTFFVMSTNCALFTDTLLSCTGIDILNVNNIISPGAFYDYLETEFLKPGSMVISRDIYKYAPDQNDSPDPC